jgi:hypothetical protein
MNYSILFTALFFVSCASTPLSPEEKAVRILRKSDPEKGCKEIGKVHAPGLASITDEGRENDLKQATFKSGGDTVTLDRIDENNTYFGTAFKCNK